MQVDSRKRCFDQLFLVTSTTSTQCTIDSLFTACFSSCTLDLHTLAAASSKARSPPKAGRNVGENCFSRARGLSEKLEKYITSVCFEVFSTCVKTSFFMRLVKTLCQNLGQILPESFYRILGKVGFHDTLRPA